MNCFLVFFLLYF